MIGVDSTPADREQTAVRRMAQATVPGFAEAHVADGQTVRRVVDGLGVNGAHFEELLDVAVSLVEVGDAFREPVLPQRLLAQGQTNPEPLARMGVRGQAGQLGLELDRTPVAEQWMFGCGAVGDCPKQSEHPLVSRRVGSSRLARRGGSGLRVVCAGTTQGQTHRSDGGECRPSRGGFRSTFVHAPRLHARSRFLDDLHRRADHGRDVGRVGRQDHRVALLGQLAETRDVVLGDA